MCWRLAKGPSSGDGMTKKRLCVIIVLTLSIAGCGGNPFTQHYRPTVYQQLKDTAVPSLDLPQVIMTDDRKKEEKTLFEQGYLPIGVSRWKGPQVIPDLAIEQAKMVGAEIVAVEAKYLRAQSAALPLRLPPTTNSTTNSNIGGQYGTASTSTSGTQTQHIPYNVDRFNYVASFWVIRKAPPVFGVIVANLELDDKRLIDRNKGVKVTAMVRNSPAFDSGIFEEDIVIRINSEEISDKDNFVAVIMKYAGQKIEIALFRNGKERIIPVQLNASLE
jgi:hypothetical protein